MFKKLLAKEKVTVFAITAGISLLLFRQLLLHFSTDLLDAFDFPYYAWVLHHGVTFLISPVSSSFLDTNAFYPASNTFFFSDLLLTQAALGILPTLLGFNQIIVTNFVIVSTLLLNAASAVFLWQTKFKRTTTLVFATLATALSPFIFTQLGHLQMLTLWPFFISLGILMSSKNLTKKSATVIGILWFLQFLASFYLSIFLLGVLGWYTFCLLISTKKWQMCLVFLLWFGFVAGALSSFFIFKYLEVKNTYGIQTSVHEFITFSAHPTDYLFIPYRSLVSQFTGSWQRLNHHNLGEVATYPGTATLLLAIVTLVQIKKGKNSISFSFKADHETLFFGGLMVIGFFFSLGPRLSFNGTYAHLPMPYLAVLKLFPFLDTIRATARWSLLLYVGLVFFAAQTIENRKSFKVSLVLASLAVTWFCIEVLPIHITTVPVASALESAHPITTVCQQPQVLAIFPFTEQNAEASLTTNLARKTKELLRSTTHHCQLINGYGGFEPPAYQQLERELNQSLGDQDMTAFWQLLATNNVDLAYIDTTLLSADTKTFLDQYFNTHALTDMQNPPVTELQSEKNSWYLVHINQYDTVKLENYGT